MIQMLTGYGKVGFQLDSRSHVSILHGLIQVAPPENAALFKCSLGFYALLRVAEITVVWSNKSDVPLQLNQLTQLVDINNKVGTQNCLFIITNTATCTVILPFL